MDHTEEAEGKHRGPICDEMRVVVPNVPSVPKWFSDFSSVICFRVVLNTKIFFIFVTFSDRMYNFDIVVQV